MKRFTTRPETVNKMYSFLKLLKRKIKNPKHINMAITLSSNNMPIDYGGILSKAGAITKIDGGKRGLSSYVWNKDIEVTRDLAEDLIKRYNELRDVQKTRRVTRTGKKTNEQHLIDIKVMLKKILHNQEK